MVHALNSQSDSRPLSMECLPNTLPPVTETLSVSCNESLHPVARRSVWAHLRKLGAEGRAATIDVDDPDATWFTPDR